ncbi:MAG: AraC family transcriptional regulator [Planctomycetota bacterium]|jgi:AraC-like DNA-binding protein|nr:AraC family transcriptional regulator [Planctomycetota bacterium]
MEHAQSVAWWRVELDRLLAMADNCALHDIAVSLQRPESPCQNSPDPVLNWAWRGHLRYRVDGRWRRFGRRDLGYARAGSWKQRAEAPTIAIGKVVVRPGDLVLVRNDGGAFRAALRYPLPDRGLAARYEAACVSTERRALRIRIAVGELLLTAHDLVAADRGRADPGAALFAAAVAAVDDGIDGDLDRSVIAQRIGCHPGHLSRLFRHHTGEAFTPWLRRRRLALAQRLLADTELSIAAVAAASGFTSATYFIRCFRAEHATSPQRWRSGLGRAVHSAI